MSTLLKVSEQFFCHKIIRSHGHSINILNEAIGVLKVYF